MDFWSSAMYDDRHRFVSNFGKDIMNLLSPEEGERILDVGCGTGDLANEIEKSGTNITGVDRSSNMIQEAQKKYPNLRFHTMDIYDMNFNNEFDAVFSNATLHWVTKPKKALEKLYQSLHKDGRIVVEFGGKGNVQHIRQAIQASYHKLFPTYADLEEPWYFPSIGEYTSLMEEVGFTVSYAKYFTRPTPLDGEDGLKNWIFMFAAGMLAHLSETEKDQLGEHVEQVLKPTLYRDHQWLADYCRIQVIGYKK
ncbi:Ubiquinone/menaquinone biosynthesis C-methylase UbiE [Gracilibacillus orientalis]|uniref:Ubiquinone/menaquinone biosynthesis C-methylase UbiE n=1 Tax=Gracilibacillus orientalis TaxID=334253 RepID=A0A1I4RGB0_9BACI|nr:class I SAM-dependent methyltransferase [Gracilibacillus orientalis]SFM51281.1 Ubiquinone/menaquinone biosynthesis C-methylase UbiE [Gracilibacillus orientalis]